MSTIYRTIVLVITIAFALLNSAMAAETSEDKRLLPKDLIVDWFQFNNDYFMDDVIVLQKPCLDLLEDSEKRVVYVVSRDDSVDLMRMSWLRALCTNVAIYYHKFDALPSIYDDNAWMKTMEVADLQEDSATWLHSPITGGFVRLDCVQFRRGEVYMVVLTEDEINELSENLGGFSELLESMTPDQSVFYVRAYGEAHTIMTAFLIQ